MVQITHERNQINKHDRLLPMQLLVVLNEILLKLAVGFVVLNLSVGLKECSNAIWVPRWLHTDTDIVVVELEVQVPLILDDHVVKNHTTCHYVVEGFLV